MDSALINRMLDLRVKDMAGQSAVGSVEDRRLSLAKCLGLEPWLARPELIPTTTGVIARDGYRIEKLAFQSRPGVFVNAHLYVGDGGGKRPLVLRPHDHWPFGMNTPVVQAGAISLALHGFACLVVGSPGVSDDGIDDGFVCERRAMGTHNDAFLAMGAPVQGVYVWDILRALDALQGYPDIDADRVGITGEGTSADTAIYAFALDSRIKAAAFAAGVESRQLCPALGCACRTVPGVVAVGDRSDLIALRAPTAPVLLMAAEDDPIYPLAGHDRTADALRRAYRGRAHEGHFRYERFFGGHDYNRRMRECALAFFREHLCGSSPAAVCPEVRPLTDGHLNPYPSGTVEPTAPELSIFGSAVPPLKTFVQLLGESLSDSHPSTYRVDQRVAPWRKYGSIPALKPGAILAIHDVSVTSSSEPGSLALDETAIDMRLCHLLGLSVAETLAQIIHLALPGGPETWEATGSGLGPDPFTSMIASMKTLVTTPEAPPKAVVAEGPVASMVARFLGRYRPTLDVQASHVLTGWQDALSAGVAPNAQPLARYLEWI